MCNGIINHVPDQKKRGHSSPRLASDTQVGQIAESGNNKPQRGAAEQKLHFRITSVVASRGKLPTEAAAVIRQSSTDALNRSSSGEVLLMAGWHLQFNIFHRSSHDVAVAPPPKDKEKKRSSTSSSCCFFLPESGRLQRESFNKGTPPKRHLSNSAFTVKRLLRQCQLQRNTKPRTLLQTRRIYFQMRSTGRPNKYSPARDRRFIIVQR